MVKRYLSFLKPNLENVFLQLHATWKKTKIWSEVRLQFQFLPPFALVCHKQFKKASSFKLRSLRFKRQELCTLSEGGEEGEEEGQKLQKHSHPLWLLSATSAAVRLQPDQIWCQSLSTKMKRNSSGKKISTKQWMCDSQDTLLLEDELPSGLFPWNGEVCVGSSLGSSPIVWTKMASLFPKFFCCLKSGFLSTV